MHFYCHATATTPDVEWSGVDAGFSPEPKTLRAPDVAVGAPVGQGSGWIPGAPQLAVEYAAAGQDEAKLEQKIRDLLAAGTRYIWVVRLVGPRRVEVYEPGQPMRTLIESEELVAPGVLRNPVPVKALYDRDAAHQVALRNLLQRQGYQDLGSVRAEGERAGMAQSVLELLVGRGLTVSPDTQERILACTDPNLLRRWLVRAASVATAEEVFAGE